MAKTKISDVIVPQVFLPYMINKTAEKSVLLNCGIMAPSGVKVPAGGTTVKMPFWNDLSGEDEVLSDTDALTVDKITSGQDIAVLNARGKAWSTNDLAGLLAGDDPAEAIASLMAGFWNRRYQAALISVLKGATAAANMTGNVLNVSTLSGADGIIRGEVMVDGAFLLGDSYSELVGVMMHSAVLSKLVKLNLIEYKEDSEGKLTIPKYQEKRVIVDDGLTPTTITVDSVSKKAYPIYMFGNGAIAYDEGNDLAEVETDRDILAGDEVITSRRTYLIHPRGIKWQGTPAGVTPTNIELATPANWTRVYEPKQIRIVKIIARID